VAEPPPKQEVARHHQDEPTSAPASENDETDATTKNRNSLPCGESQREIPLKVNLPLGRKNESYHGTSTNARDQGQVTIDALNYLGA
jgi:hypothetical protein